MKQFLYLLILIAVSNELSATTIIFGGAPSTTFRNLDGSVVTASQNATITVGTTINGVFMDLVGSQGSNMASIGSPSSPLFDGHWLGRITNNSLEADFFNNLPIMVQTNIPISPDNLMPIYTTDLLFPVNRGGLGDSINVFVDSITGVVPEPSTSLLFFVSCMTLLWRREKRTVTR